MHLTNFSILLATFAYRLRSFYSLKICSNSASSRCGSNCVLHITRTMIECLSIPQIDDHVMSVHGKHVRRKPLVEDICTVHPVFRASIIGHPLSCNATQQLDQCELQVEKKTIVLVMKFFFRKKYLLSVWEHSAVYIHTICNMPLTKSNDLWLLLHECCQYVCCCSVGHTKKKNRTRCLFIELKLYVNCLIFPHSFLHVGELRVPLTQRRIHTSEIIHCCDVNATKCSPYLWHYSHIAKI